MKRRVLLLAAAMLLAAPAPAQLATPAAAEPLRRVLSVYDGDTATLRGLGSTRFAGYDTPERGHRAKCPLERRLAMEAGEAFAALVKPGVHTRRARDDRGRLQPMTDRYGRPLRAATTADGRDVAAAMIAARSSDGRILAVPYWGRGAKRDWCAP